MGVFSGLLNGLLGGSGLGDVAQKAMGIADKIINRPKGMDVGQALIGQLPSIASGLGGIAKNFGGFIPGVGGIVSKIGGAVEGLADDYSRDQEDELKRNVTQSAKETQAANRAEGYSPFEKSMWDNWGSYTDAENPFGSSKELFSQPEFAGMDLYDMSDANDNKMHAAFSKLIKRVEGGGVQDSNSASHMLRHASNNMQFTPGNSFGMHKDIIPPKMTQELKDARDYPTNSSGANKPWRSFAQTNNRSISMVNPFGGSDSDSMYASHTPEVAFRSSARPQTLSDLGVAKLDGHSKMTGNVSKKKMNFKKNFLR